MESALKGKADEAVSVDSIGMEEYCRGLGEYLLKCDTPMTISIQGKWGSGKTSTFNIIEESVLKEQAEAKKCLIVRFNTWMYATAAENRNLTLLLMNNLLNQLKHEIETTKFKYNEEAKNLVKRLGKILKLSIVIATDKLVCGTFAEVVGKILGDEGNSITDESVLLKEIKDTMAKLVDIYCKGDADDERRVVIFVDDLDRLEPKMAVELLEGIKNFLDCAHCVFVLAIDDSVVYQGVYEKYNLDRNVEANRIKAENFFDKIIQVPFSMPTGIYDIEKYIGEYIDDEMADYTGRYSYLIHKFIPDNNPRAIKRVFNVYDLNRIIHAEKFKEGEDNHTMQLCLFLVTLIQVAKREFYLSCLNHVADFEDFIFNSSDEKSKKMAAVISSLSEIEIREEMHDKDDDESDDEENINSLIEIQNKKLLEKICTFISSTKERTSCAYFVGGFNNARNYLVMKECTEDTLMLESRLLSYYVNDAKFCRFNSKNDEEANVTIYGKENVAKALEFAEKNGVKQRRVSKDSNYVTFANLSNNDFDDVIAKMFESLLG